MSRAVAVLRPEPANGATAAVLEAAGVPVLRMPLFFVRPIAWVPPDPAGFDALLLTSANAVRHAGPGLAKLRALPVHAVGAATAAAARAAGLTVVATDTGGAAALVAAARDAGVGRALLLGGRERMLGAGGIVAQAVTVYASEPLALADDALASLAGTVALVQSARAGARLAALLNPDRRATITLAAISPAAAGAAGAGWRQVAIAERPAALIDLARALAE
jgi:uroporphyrinogen-III synthase